MSDLTRKDDDASWMARCLDLALRGAGAVSPNPLVGAVVAGPSGNVLGEGWHEQYGGPHAEVNAIRQVEKGHGVEALRQATLYVNLEPCSHYGKTPPCADLILEKGISRVIVGMIDPFGQVSGRGVARLREHGVEVVTGVLEHQCLRLNEAFVHHVQTGRPLVTLKIAQTLDGRVATKTGDSRWVSGEASRSLVHRWRSEMDGVLVGANTAAQDDPALTVRMVKGRQPIRVVLDRTGRLGAELKLFSDDWASNTVAVTRDGQALAYADQLRKRGGRIIEVPEANGHLSLLRLFEKLGQGGRADGRPLQSLLVEAGPGLASALIEQDLADRLFVFIAPKILGAGTSGLELPPVQRMSDALSFAEGQWEQIGDDMLFRGYRRHIAAQTQATSA